jgi:N-acetylglucosamine-6-phosphate deacetylase
VTTLTASTVITPDAVLSPGAVSIDGGRIVDVRAGGTNPLDVTLVPGFVDVQVNGIGDVNVADATGADWDYLDARLLAQGVTAWCPTLVTSPLDSYAAPLASMAAAQARDGHGRPAILGAHLEGPFLGGAPGAHRVEYLRPFDRGWIDALPPVVRLVTLAPELDGAVEVIAALVARGVLVSIGHSTATYEQAGAAADAGARLVTHCFNGMGPLHHRQPGLLGAALTDDRLCTGLIADLVHCHPAAIRLAFKAKGAGRVVMVTDSVAWRGNVTDAPRLGDGTLAGSVLAMDVAIANAVRYAGVALEDAVRAASTTPADVIGEADRGRIESDTRADLVALDAHNRAVTTWIAGEVAHQS